ncbi:UDP-glcnac-adolichol phosphate glcnac-1-p-transferase, partial [Prunus dulcis]
RRREDYIAQIRDTNIERERERERAMAARKRASKDSSAQTKPNDTTTRPKPQEPPLTDPPIAPPKSGVILKLTLFFSVPYFYLIFYHYKIEHELRKSILINAALSLAGFFVTVKMIPVASRYVLKRNLFGYDINKKGTPQGTVKVPESLGIVVGIVFLVLGILFQYFNFTADSNWLVEYNAALASICFMVLLGFVDDVLDIPWRVKLLLPSFAALPLLMAYAGHTTIIIPKPLIPYVGLEVLDLGWMYKLYMGLLAVFCTNSINIHAGLNGLEVGQTVVIASAILIHNIMQIGASADSEYPSSAFVGDTYTYFAGMTMAVAGILGHFSETLLIFFVPQVLNFLLSLPQLAGIVPCPRHRLPKFDPGTGLLTGTNDGTLVNFFLRRFGRMTEKSLCIYLLVFQKGSDM